MFDIAKIFVLMMHSYADSIGMSRLMNSSFEKKSPLELDLETQS